MRLRWSRLWYKSVSIGCGACESICDAVFHVEDKAEVTTSGIAGNEECVKEAATACPVSAIEIA